MTNTPSILRIFPPYDHVKIAHVSIIINMQRTSKAGSWRSPMRRSSVKNRRTTAGIRGRERVPDCDSLLPPRLHPATPVPSFIHVSLFVGSTLTCSRRARSGRCLQGPNLPTFVASRFSATPANTSSYTTTLRRNLLAPAPVLRDR